MSVIDSGLKDASHFPFSGRCTLVHLCNVRSALRMDLSNSLARATPVWKNRGLVTALHTTSSDQQNLDSSRE